MRQLPDLPVLKIAGAVNEALAASPCVVVTAPPGAGKSTLLPLTILNGGISPEPPATSSLFPTLPKQSPGAGRSADADFASLNRKATSVKGKILMLEPRRLAARQIAERMAALLGEPVGRTVGYRIRFESRVSAATRIEVLTEGILTRMLVDDPGLEGVDVVIFDEFHERSLQSDVALALTRESQQLLRPDLRLLVMSATIDTEALCRALDAPLIESAGRMFPVDVRHTPEEATAQDVAERVAHQVRVALREHEGDILAFLPGEAEIRRCAEGLEGIPGRAGNDKEGAGNDSRRDGIGRGRGGNDKEGAGIDIYPLYGLLPPEQQRAAIAPSPPGRRKVVLATPIAETSLTIEGVRVVVDGGFCRRLVFDPQNALSRLETVRISRDMADQRSGRAGRVAPGVCYRLWSLATETRMAATRVPEILEADLSGTVLDAAAWGENHPERLPWLTPPPPAHLARARSLLELLGAVDGEGRITPHGRRLAALPCHPRIAQMLLKCGGISPEPPAPSSPFQLCKGHAQAGGGARSQLAAEIAALLEERDPLASLEQDASLSTRLEALHRGGGRWARIRQMAEQYRQLAARHSASATDPASARGGNDPQRPRQSENDLARGGNDSQRPRQPENDPARGGNGPQRPRQEPGATADPFAVGRLLAQAYPERVAKARGDGPGRFQLATGELAAVDPGDALAACDWLSVASVSVRPGGVGRIFLAAPLDPEDVPELIRTRDRVAWDSKAGAAVAQRERRIGGLLVDARPLSEGVREPLTRVICEAAQKEGTAMLDFSDEVGNLQRRVAAVAAWHPELELPDLSTDAVLKTAPQWLPSFVGNATTVAQLKKIDLCTALWSLLDYAQQQAVDRLAPTHIAVPTGSRIRLEYRQGAEAPVLRVRLQECFGLLDTPRVDDGRRPVLMELLSPGYKPVQLTSDLRSFWSGTYFEVRKELRRRYPRHAWPGDPLQAEAVRGVKKN